MANTLLPQQRLLLELIKMSGDIAVPHDDDGTLLFRTLREVTDLGLLVVTPFGGGFDKASITDAGRDAIKDRRQKSTEMGKIDRRRSKLA